MAVREKDLRETFMCVGPACGSHNVKDIASLEISIFKMYRERSYSTYIQASRSLIKGYVCSFFHNHALLMLNVFLFNLLNLYSVANTLRLGVGLPYALLSGRKLG